PAASKMRRVASCRRGAGMVSIRPPKIGQKIAAEPLEKRSQTTPPTAPLRSPESPRASKHSQKTVLVLIEEAPAVELALELDRIHLAGRNGGEELLDLGARRLKDAVLHAQ